MTAEKFPTEQWGAWRKDFDAIKDSLVGLGVKRVIHRAHHTALGNRKIEDGTGIVHYWMDDNYADSILMGLRRILDDRKGSFSFVRVLADLRKNRSLLTFERYSKLLESTMDRHQGVPTSCAGGGAKRVVPALVDKTGFDRVLYGTFSSDGRNLDAGRIDADIATLRAGHSKVLDFVNTIIAHRKAGDTERRDAGPSPQVTWQDVDSLFDDVAALFNKYYSLVDPGVHVDFTPVLPAGFEQAFLRMVGEESPTSEPPAWDGSPPR